MKYSLTTSALVGAIFVATGSANPISTGSLSTAISTPSFSPYYAKVAGNFTAIAGSSPTTTPAPSSSLDFSGFPTNFGLGPVILQSSNPEPSNPLSTSIVGTPTKTSVTGSATEDLFADFTPHFGHGPAVPARGFNQTKEPSNSTMQILKLAPARSFLDDTVPYPSYPHDRCKYYSMRWVCERWVRIDRWWNAGRVSHHEHASHKARHKLTLHHARSIQMDFNSTNSSVAMVPVRNSTSTPVSLKEHNVEATSSPTPSLSMIPTPARKSSSTTTAKHMTHADRVRAGRELNHKIREKEKMMDFYRKSIAKTKQQINNLRDLFESSTEQILVLEARDTFETAQLKKIEIELRKLRLERHRLEYGGRRWY